MNQERYRLVEEAQRILDQIVEAGDASWQQQADEAQQALAEVASLMAGSDQDEPWRVARQQLADRLEALFPTMAVQSRAVSGRHPRPPQLDRLLAQLRSVDQT